MRYFVTCLTDSGARVRATSSIFPSLPLAEGYIASIPPSREPLAHPVGEGETVDLLPRIDSDDLEVKTLPHLAKLAEDLHSAALFDEVGDHQDLTDPVIANLYCTAVCDLDRAYHTLRVCEAMVEKLAR